MTDAPLSDPESRDMSPGAASDATTVENRHYLRSVEARPDVTQMMLERSAEQVWLTVLGPGEAQDFDGVALAAGLEPLGRAWVEVNAQRAESVLAALLHKDLAYKSEVMREHTARWLASEFLRGFGRYGSRFATNSSDMPDQMPWSWTPATDATFDSGVVVIGEAGSGIYWVADED
jgi:hypothetical protein